MLKYTPLKSAMNNVVPGVLKEDSINNLLFYALEAYRSLNSSLAYEQSIKLFEIKDHKVILPPEVESINMVTFLTKTPTIDDWCDLCTTEGLECGECSREAEGFDTTTNNICRYSLNYKLFLDSPFFNNNFYPLKYIGNSDYSLICKDCPNRYFNYINDTFSVDKNRFLWTSIKCGILCVDYNTEVKDANGDFLILDYPDIKQYLAYYAMAMHWLDRASTTDDGRKNMTMYDNMLAKANIYYIKAMGLINMMGLNANMNREIAFTGTTNQKLIRVPSLFYIDAAVN